MSRLIPHNFWARLDTFPPCAIRLLARNKGQHVRFSERAMNDQQIAAASGLSVTVVRLLSHMTTWNGVEMQVARAYLKGCGIDLTDRRDVLRLRDYLSRVTKWKYLRYSPLYESTFKPILALREQLTTRTNTNGQSTSTT